MDLSPASSQYSLFICCHSCSTIHPLYSKNHWSHFCDMHHLVSGINFLTLLVSLDLIYLLQIHHFFLITSAYQFQHHHSLLPSPLLSFILASKPYFSINPTLHRPLVPSGLISRITWLFIGFPCSTVLLLFQFFFRFQFSKSFSSSVIFSSLLLSTPIYPIIGSFLGESASL